MIGSHVSPSCANCRLPSGRRTTGNREMVATLDRPAQKGLLARSLEALFPEVEWRDSYFAQVVSITPYAAEKLLTEHNAINRTFYQGRADFYGQEMQLGFWKNTSGAIGIDRNGQLTNGQHRLGGVVAYGRPVEMIVAFNCDSDCRSKEDCGKVRSEADRIRLSGTEADRDIVTVARGFLVLPRHNSGKIRLELLSDCIKQYREYLDFGARVCSGDHGGVDHGTVKAAVARAAVHVGQSRLEEFISIAKTGMATSPEDGAAARFAKWLVGNPLRAGGGTQRAMLYRYTTSAIKAFIERRPITKLYAADQDYFPVPDDLKERLSQLE